MAFKMKYNKSSFPFKESPVKAADADLVQAAMEEGLGNVPQTEAPEYVIPTGTMAEAVEEVVDDLSKDDDNGNGDDNGEDNGEDNGDKKKKKKKKGTKLIR